MVENYRYGDSESNAYLINELCFHEKMIKDGKLYVYNDIREFNFSWHRDFGKLIEMAEFILFRKRYKRTPIILNIRELVASLFIPPLEYGLGYHYAESFIVKEHGSISTIDWLQKIEFHNYMEYVPREAMVKYPMYLVMKKNKLTQECIVKKCGGLKYPTISEAMMEGFVWLPEDEKADHELLVVVIESYAFYIGAKELDKALWAFKNYENIMELYDGAGIMDVFVDFIKQPFEDGLVTFEKEESDI